MQTIMQVINIWRIVAILYCLLSLFFNVVFSGVFAFLVLFSNLKTMAILQQNHYCVLPTLKWLVLSKFKQINLIDFVCSIVILIINQIFIFAGVSLFYFYVLFLVLICKSYYFSRNNNLIKLKKELCITNRIKRLITVGFIFGFVLFFVFQWLAFFVSVYFVYFVYILHFVSFIVLLLSFYIFVPVEKLISYSYVLKARRKLKCYSDLTIVAITGSFGKTSTKNYLYEMLKVKYDVLCSPMSYNTPMGVTKTILERLKPYHKILVLEFGADHKNDIKKLCNIVSPNISVVTSVGEQHLKTFKNVKNIIKTKYQIVEGTKSDGFFVTNLENKVCNSYYHRAQIKSFGVGKSQDCFCKIHSVQTTKQGIIVSGIINNENFCLTTKLLGEFNAINLCLALTVAYSLGVSVLDVENVCEHILPVSHRLQLKRLNNGAVLIDDSFNSNPVGAKCAVETLKLLGGTTIIITCGMVDLGEKQYGLNYQFGTLLKDVDVVLIVNNVNYKAISDGLFSVGGNNPTLFNSFIDAYNFALKYADDNATILIENDLTDSYIL